MCLHSGEWSGRGSPLIVSVSVVVNSPMARPGAMTCWLAIHTFAVHLNPASPMALQAVVSGGKSR